MASRITVAFDPELGDPDPFDQAAAEVKAAKVAVDVYGDKPFELQFVETHEGDDDPPSTIWCFDAVTSSEVS